MLFAMALLLGAAPHSRAQSTASDLDSQLQQLAKDGHFPGVAVAIMKQGKVQYQHTFGYASLAHQVAVTPSTVFELASLSKHMTALAVTTLAQQGKLKLEDKLSLYLSDIPEAWNAITVDQLLSHQGGLTHRFEHLVDGEFLLQYSQKEMLESAKQTPMVAEPGEDWHYSDQGYFLLGLVIEKVTGLSFAQYMQKTFFQPLDMVQTHLLNQHKIVPHLAQGYAFVDGQLQRNRRVWQFETTPHFGVMSSLNDMIKWEQALIAAKVINKQALKDTFVIERPFSTGERCEQWGYGRGWQVRHVDGKTIVSHGGYAGTAYIRVIDTGMSVIVLTNREDSQEAASVFSLAWAAAHWADASIPSEGHKCWPN